ncbi:hypothetical protein QRX60_45125 [Amycolatopsis mongoliensis]|uniref:Uncharacterized protein n=1 Tax=Amycolatopsis mongoliensis TaxID=715475 RepID=A0A9Y2JPB9_9PSEU|nr:hypothetical protein [Amycolatopsis sp. 4-36]WIY01146.1 hypothetical protein QRX60_45125 [Amycolatopsis sp. 4-36]
MADEHDRAIDGSDAGPDRRRVGRDRAQRVRRGDDGEAVGFEAGDQSTVAGGVRERAVDEDEDDDDDEDEDEDEDEGGLASVLVVSVLVVPSSRRELW